MTLNNWKMIVETRNYIFRWHSRFRPRRVCLSSPKTGHFTSSKEPEPLQNVKRWKVHVQSVQKITVFHCQICKFVGFLLPSSSWLLKLPNISKWQIKLYKSDISKNFCFWSISVSSWNGWLHGQCSARGRRWLPWQHQETCISQWEGSLQLIVVPALNGETQSLRHLKIFLRSHRL